MKPIKYLLSLAVVLIALFIADASPPVLTDAESSVAKSESTQPVAASTDVVVAPVIVEERAIANYADRVTATVARKNLAGGVVRIPEAPTFEIGHVPLA